MISIRNAEVANKKVVLRLDLDVPVEKGLVLDQTRLRAALPTLKFLLQNHATIIIISHAGRPNGQVDERYSLRPMLACLMELLDNQYTYEIIDRPMAPLEGTIFALENLRYNPGEEANSSEFSKYLASFGDVYCNDSFAVSHRDHASFTGIAKLLPGYAGIHLLEEVEQLEAVMRQPAHPLVAILGGSKVETKMPAINNMAKFADTILLGGKLVAEADSVVLPPQVHLGKLTSNGFDITPESAQEFAAKIAQAKTIIWNGPLGKFEEPPYDQGTKIVAQAVAANKSATRVIGGGDTIAALNQFNLADQSGYISTGGGAMLDFLAGDSLPGLAAIGYQPNELES